MPASRPPGQKEEQGHTTLYLENFKLAPGDVVSMYATAADANKTTRSDILFAQAEAYDYKFSQSQQSGGGMGGGAAQDNNISERQKQIIAATFNELRKDSESKAAIQEQAHFLSDLESKLSEQAQTLAQRMGNRELSQANSEFENFSKLMTFAASEMGEAVQQLSPAKWHDALGARAESPAIAAARRSHVPEYPGGVRPAGRGRERRGSPARSGSHVRS